MIQKIEQKEVFEHRWIRDVERIQEVLLYNGYSSTLRDCANLWDDYSEAYAAGWLGLPDDDRELWDILINRI